MRLYPVPTDMGEKEKIIGGILDLGQAAWLAAGFGLGLSVFILLYGIIGMLSLILAIPVAFSGLPFVLYKPKGLTLFQYLKRKNEYKKKIKVLPFKRKNFNW